MLAYTRQVASQLGEWKAPLIGAAAALVAFVFVAQNSETFRTCIENYQYKAAQRTLPKQISDVPIPFGVRVNCWGTYIRETAEGITAVFTIILAGSTIALWLSTKRLWRVTDESLRHAEKTTQRQLRAYIGVEPRGVKRIAGQDRLLGHFAIRNFGRIPAKNISMYTLTDYYADPTKMVFKVSQIYQSKTTLPPRAEMVFGAASSVGIDDIDIIEDGSADYVGFIFVYGKVTYTDEFNTDGWTEFCHRYPVEMMDGDSRIRRKYARYHEIAGNNAG
jgi:hypothetical protein